MYQGDRPVTFVRHLANQCKYTIISCAVVHEGSNNWIVVIVKFFGTNSTAPGSEGRFRNASVGGVGCSSVTLPHHRNRRSRVFGSSRATHTRRGQQVFNDFFGLLGANLATHPQRPTSAQRFLCAARGQPSDTPAEANKCSTISLCCSGATWPHTEANKCSTTSQPA